MAKKLTDEDLRLNIIINGDGAKKALLDQQKEVDSLKKKISDCNQELDKFTKGGGSTNDVRYKNSIKILDEYKSKLASAQTALSSLNRQQNINKMTMSELSKHIRLTSIALRNAEPGSANWKKFNNELKTSKKRLKELRDQSESTGGILKKMSLGGLFGWVGGITAVTSAVSTAVKKIAEFEQANANLATILGKSTKDIAGLTRSAKHLGETTEYTASQVTSLQTELAKLGFQEATITGMQKSVLNFATAVGADLGEAAALAGATLRMFDLRASDTEETLGMMALATNKSALNFSYLQAALSTVGPVAKTFGFSVKDTVTLLGTLANAGFDASSAATATRNILLNLADANGKLAQKLGGSVRDFNGLMTALSDLNKQGVDLAETLDLTDKRSVAAFNQFLTGAESAKALSGELSNVKGELERIAEQRLDTVEGSVKKLQSAWEGFTLSMSNSKGVMKSVIDFFTECIKGLQITLFPEQAKQNASSEIQANRLALLMEIYSKYGRDKSVDLAERMRDKDSSQWKKAQEDYRDMAPLNRLFGGKSDFEWAKTVHEAVTEADKLFFKFIEEQDAIKAAADAALGSQVEAEKKLDKDKMTKTKGSAPDKATISESQKWSLENDEEYLKASADLKERYHINDIDDETLYQYRLAQLTSNALKKRLDMDKESGLERTKLEIKLRESMEREEDLIVQLPLKAIKKKQDELDAQIKIDKEIYQLKKAEKKAKFSVEEESLALGSDDLYTKKREHNAELIKLDLEYLNTLKKTLEQVVSEGTIDGVALSKDVINVYKNQLSGVISQISQIKKDNRMDLPEGESSQSSRLQGTGKGELFGVSQEQWNQFFYNLENGKLQAEDIVTALSGLGQVAQQGFQLATQAIALTAAQEQKEMKAFTKNNDKKKKELKKRLDAGQMSQAQYDSAIQRLEERQEAKQEAMQLKQARRTKALNLSQAIINTSLGIAKTLAQWGIPWGLAPAAIMGAMGAAQVALIAATPVSGKAKGGALDDAGTFAVKRKEDGRIFSARLSPEKRGYINHPTVIVGESGSEYVLPHEALENPSILPFISTIETARRNGSLKNIDLSAMGAAHSVRGRASGGFIGEGMATPVPQTITTIDEEMKAVLKLLTRQLSSPIRADVSMLGPKGIVAKSQEYNRQRERGRV